MMKLFTYLLPPCFKPFCFQNPTEFPLLPVNSPAASLLQEKTAAISLLLWERRTIPFYIAQET